MRNTVLNNGHGNFLNRSGMKQASRNSGLQDELGAGRDTRANGSKPEGDHFMSQIRVWSLPLLRKPPGFSHGNATLMNLSKPVTCPKLYL